MTLVGTPEVGTRNDIDSPGSVRYKQLSRDIYSKKVLSRGVTSCCTWA